MTRQDIYLSPHDHAALCGELHRQYGWNRHTIARYLADWRLFYGGSDAEWHAWRGIT